MEREKENLLIKVKKKYVIWGNVPRVGFIQEWVWAFSEKQAFKLIYLRLEERYKGEKIIIPPLTYYCQIEEIPTLHDPANGF